ncbi:hypothetical protein GE061_002819 [Apolygus lucorum]|uniref:Uncharacterized protein n=1 Tax=Apolygus lucorum TaxID=248454 RepID=A0A6A4JIX9_APOLU|nr:hypothetical protein GE061_002819 [Apolygus lucorum]
MTKPKGIFKKKKSVFSGRPNWRSSPIPPMIPLSIQTPEPGSPPLEPATSTCSCSGSVWGRALLSFNKFCADYIMPPGLEVFWR